MHRVPAGKHGITARNLTDYGDVAIVQSMCFLEWRRNTYQANELKKERERDDKSFINQYF